MDADARRRRAGLGGILVHHLGASQRWRHGFQDTGESPGPEDDPLPTIGQLHERWEAEWAAVDAWLSTLTDDSSRTSTKRYPFGRCWCTS